MHIIYRGIVSDMFRTPYVIGPAEKAEKMMMEERGDEKGGRKEGWKTEEEGEEEEKRRMDEQGVYGGT